MTLAKLHTRHIHKTRRRAGGFRKQREIRPIGVHWQISSETRQVTCSERISLQPRSCSKLHTLLERQAYSCDSSLSVTEFLVTSIYLNLFLTVAMQLVQLSMHTLRISMKIRPHHLTSHIKVAKQHPGSRWRNMKLATGFASARTLAPLMSLRHRKALRKAFWRCAAQRNRRLAPQSWRWRLAGAGGSGGHGKS